MLESKEIGELISELARVVAKVIRWRKLSPEEREELAGKLIEIGGKLAVDLID